MTPALLTRNDAALTVTFTPEAKELRTQAMLLAVEIESITDAAEQEKAVQAQKALTEFLKTIEDSRKAVKQPVLDYGRAIDAAAKEFIANVQNEATRISRLIGDFQAIERAKQQAAEAARNEELTRLERERAAELAKANSFKEREVIQERFHQEVEAANAAASRHVAPRVEGQRIADDWEFEVVDKRLLAQMHPDLVNIEPRRGEIKERLKIGQKVHGVEARKVTKSSVRAGKQKELPVLSV